MADNKFPCGPVDKACSRPEMVCIEANRILDSCRDRDCFEDVKVLLTDFGNDLLEHTTNVRAKVPVSRGHISGSIPSDSTVVFIP